VTESFLRGSLKNPLVEFKMIKKVVTRAGNRCEKQLSKVKKSSVLRARLKSLKIEEKNTLQ
jgi:hypothetical protein